MIRCRVLPYLLALVVALAAAASAPAQQDDKRPAIPFEGYEVFSYLLKARGYKPVASIADLNRLDSPDTLVILFGELKSLNQLNNHIRNLGAFQDVGGSLLIASDFAHDLPDYGVRIAGVVPNQYDDQAYRETRECPLIEKLEPDAPTPFRPLTKGLATNRPSYFTSVFIAAGRRPRAVKPLAGFQVWDKPANAKFPVPLERVPVIGRSLRLPDGRFILPYAYAADTDRDTAGRALLIAGNGGFTNGMLLQSDNDNFTFAAQCLEWLGKNPGGKPRRHALFIVNGKVIDSFDVDLKPPPLPLPPLPTPTMAVVNHLLHGVQKERLLLHILEESMPARIAVRAGLIALTLLLLCYGAKKVIELRHHAERGSVLLAGPYAVPPDTALLVEQRARSQIECNALGAEARALVRAWFLEECAIPVANWDGDSTGSLPVAELAGGWWERRRVRRQIDHLVWLAGPAFPAVCAWTDMVRLTKTLQALTVLVQQGRLRVVGCSPGENS